MKGKRKWLTLIIPIVILLGTVMGSLAFARAQNLAKRENPLLEETEAAHMLISDGGQLYLPDAVLNSAGEAPVQQFEQKDPEPPSHPPTSFVTELTTTSTETTTTPPPTTTTSPPTTTTTPPPTEPTQPPTEPTPPPTEPTQPPTEPTQPPTEPTQPPTEPTQPPTEPDEPVDPSGTDTPDDPSVDPNPTEPGESDVDSGDENPKVYFRTTINDGEVVQSRHYEFEIEHLLSDHTVKEERVYVNGVQVLQFRNVVLLCEGQNTIRVVVDYTDPDGKLISVYKDYTVYVDLGEIVIITNLSEGTVDQEKYSFQAEAKLGGENVPLVVTCNDTPLTAVGKTYKAVLNEGSNTIKLNAEKDGREKSLVYHIIYVPPAEFSIETDLYDQTINDPEFSFNAKIINGSDKARLTVVFNGKTIVSSSGSYFTELQIGNNVIRLKATDNVNGKTKQIVEYYYIRYVPLADEATAPRIEHINVTDGMTVQGNLFTLDIGPVDYKGNRIYYENISVKLNGEKIYYSWANEYTSYALDFKNGANDLSIRITDSDGRFADYSYTIYCDALQEGDKLGDITIQIDAKVLGLGVLTEATTVPFHQGETGAEVLVGFLEDSGYTYSNTGTLEEGFYLSRISKAGMATNVKIPDLLVQYINEDGLEWKDQKDPNSLGEFDYCQGAGWMYTINGVYTNFGFSDAVFSDGDVIHLRFTLAYGKDIGGFNAIGSEDGNYPTTW